MAAYVPPSGVGQLVHLLIATVSRIGRLFGMGVLVFMCAPTVQAQGVYYPGSVWSAGGRLLTPTEPGNVTVLIHAEQGIAYRGAELYFVGETWNDRFDYDWNNRNVGGAGLRLTQSFKYGMVRGGIAYLTERRRLQHKTYTHGVTLLVESWFGWGRDSRPSLPTITPLLNGGL